MKDIRLVIVTGLSGAGKTQAIKCLEDLGFFCVDNLPPAFIPKMAELCLHSEGKISRLALGIDIRGRQFFESAVASLEELERSGFVYQILFLEASAETLVRRYKETRHRHPLAPMGRVEEGIKRERRYLEELRGRAHIILDTSGFTVQRLREEISQLFTRDEEIPRLIVNVVSFGFKHGLPLDADLVFDCRFLPNPHYVPTLRPLTGAEAEVREYVTKWPLTRRFLRKLTGMIEFLLPNYVTEGKTQLTVAIGCTGGRHRSVVVANHLAEWLKERSFAVVTEHRDVDKGTAGATP